MTPTELASYAMAAAGLGLVAWSLLRVTQRRLNHDAANAQILKLVAAHNLERALKLTQCVPGSYFDAVAAAIQAGTGSGSRDAGTVAAAMARAYASTGGELIAEARKIVELGFVGVMLVAGAITVASSGAIPIAVVVAAVLAGLAGAVLFSQRAFIAIALASAQHAVLPGLAAVIARGAGSKPPRPPGPRDGDIGARRRAPSSPVVASAAGLTFRVLRGTQLIATHTFTDAVIKIGNVASAQLRLDDDAVSRIHAIVDVTGERVEILDLGSDAGTFVNGEKVNRMQLHSGDTIRIGGLTLELTIEHATN